jgi:cell division protein FtsI/penicillin-binding protein 2
MGAVERGTARGARQEEPIAGKTGTCSEDHAHLGWFGAFNIVGRRLVVVVLLRGGRPASGPRAASITGEILSPTACGKTISLVRRYFTPSFRSFPPGAPPLLAKY